MSSITKKQFETLAVVALAKGPVLRGFLDEKHVKALGEAQLVDWGREPNGYQTRPSTVIPTWKGCAMVYEAMFKALHAAASAASRALEGNIDETTEHDVLVELDRALQGDLGCEHPEKHRFKILSGPGSWACPVCGHEHIPVA